MSKTLRTALMIMFLICATIVLWVLGDPEPLRTKFAAQTVVWWVMGLGYLYGQYRKAG